MISHLPAWISEIHLVLSQRDQYVLVVYGFHVKTACLIQMHFFFLGVVLQGSIQVCIMSSLAVCKYGKNNQHFCIAILLYNRGREKRNLIAK